MALKKKNVFQGFMQDDYVPSGDQQIVKYLFGKGNNLHEVETLDGSNFLVTMPKKFRQTVWLKKGDCLVIDPIPEGKKVLGEIICVVPAKSVLELIKLGEWIPKWEMKEGEDSCSEIEAGGEVNAKVTPTSGGGDAATTTESDLKNLEERKMAALIKFYSSGCKASPEEDSCMPPSESEEEDSNDDDDDDEEEEDDDQTPDHDQEDESKSTKSKGDVDVQIGNHSSHLDSIPGTLGDQGDVDVDVDGNKSRVQFLTSGIVTVTNVVNDISSLQNGLQSLDFETEDSSIESQSQAQVPRTPQKDNQSRVHRKANTIRIQVNYPPESLSENGTTSINNSRSNMGTT